MGMRKIPAETATYHFFNANPKNRRVGDCSTRALSLFLGVSWKEALRIQYEAAIETNGGITDFDVIEHALKNLGYKRMSQPKKPNGTKYKAGEFAKLAPSDKMYLCVCANHFFVIKDSKVWDIWNSTEKCVGRYWVRECADVNPTCKFLEEEKKNVSKKDTELLERYSDVLPLLKAIIKTEGRGA